MTATSSIEFHACPKQFFCIKSVERFPDGSGFVGRISLRSGNFALHDHKFYFDDLERFLSEVRSLYDTLSGVAQLRHPYERNHLSVSAVARGHILVVGHFEFFDGQSQRLEFGFDTDQTFLPAFIQSLERVCHETKIKA